MASLGPSTAKLKLPWPQPFVSTVNWPGVFVIPPSRPGPYTLTLLGSQPAIPWVLKGLPGTGTFSYVTSNRYVPTSFGTYCTVYVPSPLLWTGHKCRLPLGPVSSHWTLPRPVLVTALASTINSVGDWMKLPVKKILNY